MLVCNVVGARPNFMKIGPVVQEIARRGLPQILVHTGQHYDAEMSQVFFDELGLPAPDVYLGVGAGTHARQTSAVLVAFEDVCLRSRPDLVIVGGDVNSTLGAALAAAKLGIPLAHVEAGLRSFDRSMPEEINRVLTDHLCDLLFTTEASANDNLTREGIPPARVYFVGNCMVDSLMRHVQMARRRFPWNAFGVAPRGYALVTLHRPGNVDDPGVFEGLVQAINRVAALLPVVFPMHPRTDERFRQSGVRLAPAVHIDGPLPYLTFIGLLAEARCVLTDSGGVQEETTALGVPCLTLRRNTERPVTLQLGTNQLVGTDPERIYRSVERILAGGEQTGGHPPLWDGRAACRVADVVERWASGGKGEAVDRALLPAAGGRGS